LKVDENENTYEVTMGGKRKYELLMVYEMRKKYEL